MELKLVELQSFSSIHEAHLINHVLELEGIPSFIQNEHVNSTPTFYESVILMVHESDYSLARQIVEQSQTEGPHSLIEDNSDLSSEERATLIKQYRARDEYRSMVAKGFDMMPVIFIGMFILIIFLKMISN